MEPLTDFDEDHRYHLGSSASPPSSLSVNNSYTLQSPSPATMGSLGFDVNRSTNVELLNNTDQYINRNRTREDYNEQFVDRVSSSSSLLSKNFQSRTPTLTRQRNGKEFSAVDRLVFGPNRIKQTIYNPSDETIQEQQQQQMKINNQQKTLTEQELLAWQNRMLEREQKLNHQSPKLIHKRNGNNSSRSSNRQLSTSVRPISSSTTYNTSEYHNDQESTIKSTRVIKRYIELLYHLQTFYERITDQLYNENTFLKTNQTIYVNHCRKIAEQLQNCKPIWDKKLADLQNLLKDLSSFQWSTRETETTFLQRRSTLINLSQTLTIEKDETQESIRSDIDQVLNEDKLAIQLQDELSTLLQHQSLLKDFTSLLQWNSPIYSSNEQNRVENILPLLREQITIANSYISHVSQQLSELVKNLRSLERYILSYTNTIPLIDDEVIATQRTPSSRGRWRPYDETDIDSIQTKNSSYASDNLISKTRSISMPRYINSQEFDEEDFRSSKYQNNIELNTNNNNNHHHHTRTRVATIKSAKRDQKPPLTSILKTSSSRRKKEFDNDVETFKPNKSDISERFVDFNNNDDAEEEEAIRTRFSKQNIQDFNDEDVPFNQKRFEKALHLQSMLAEEAKEKNRQVAAKHHSNKSHQQRSVYPNA